MNRVTKAVMATIMSLVLGICTVVGGFIPSLDGSGATGIELAQAASLPKGYVYQDVGPKTKGYEYIKWCKKRFFFYDIVDEKGKFYPKKTFTRAQMYNILYYGMCYANIKNQIY